MAPSQNPSAQDGRPAVRTPPTTPRHARDPRRSASPPTQQTPIRIRDEPPARSTRSWVSAPPISKLKPSASERVPVNCPAIGCSAPTVHQHLPQLQYYNPRPGRAVQRHGYRNFGGTTTSQPSLIVSLRIARQAQGASEADAEVEPEPAEYEAAALEPDGEENGADLADVGLAEDQQADLEKAHDVRDAATEHEPAAERSYQDNEGWIGQEENTLVQGNGLQFYPNADDLRASGVLSARSILDDDQESIQEVEGMEPSLPEQDQSTFHNEGNPSLFQPPATPPPSSPPAPEETPSTQISDPSPDQQPATSPTPRVESGDGQQPPALTYDELIRPFLDPHLPPAPGMEGMTRMLQSLKAVVQDPDLPSLATRPPVTEYMRQFWEEHGGEFDWEDFAWR